MKVVPSCWSKGYFSVIYISLHQVLINSKKINKIYIQLETCTFIMHEAISYRSTSVVCANGVKHVQWNLYKLSGHLRECSSAHLRGNVCKYRAIGGHGENLNFAYILSIDRY